MEPKLKGSVGFMFNTLYVYIGIMTNMHKCLIFLSEIEIRSTNT